jgi:hypothetical protein
MKNMILFLSLISTIQASAQSGSVAHQRQGSGFTKICEDRIKMSIARRKSTLEYIAKSEHVLANNQLASYIEKNLYIQELHLYTHSVSFSGRTGTYLFLIQQVPDRNMGDNCDVSKMKISGPGIYVNAGVGSNGGD